MGGKPGKSGFVRRFIAAVVFTAMAVNFAACGKDPEPGNAAEAEQRTAQGSEGQHAADDNPAFAAVVEKLKDDIRLYGYEDPVTLKMGFSFASDFGWAGQESFEDNIWKSLYQELGYEADVLYNVDDSQSDTKLAIAITSGNYPDILSGSATEMVKYAETGVIADITEVFEEYASDQLKEYLNYGGVDNLSAGRINGRLYGIPTASEGQIEGMMMFIRKDWLDRLNLQVPKTMDELKAVAKAFTEEDPDGNGVADTYGLALCGKDGFTYWSGIQAFFEGYGAAPGYWSDNFTFIEKDGKVIWGGALADEMKAGLTALQEMYENGWLSRDFGIMDYNQLFEDIGAGTCGIYFAPRWGAMVPYVDALKSDIHAEIVAAKIPDGMGAGSSKAYVSTMPDSFHAVSSKCEHPEAVVKLMNLSVRLLANYENLDEKHMFDGQTDVYSGWKASWIGITKPGGQIDAISKEIRAMENGNSTDDMTETMVEDYEKMQIFVNAREDGTLAEMLEAKDAAIQSGISNYTVSTSSGGGAVMLEQIENDLFNYSAYNTVPTEKMASCYSVLNEMAHETMIKIIYGENVDSYDDFLDSWYLLGGEEATREAQEWYDKNTGK